MGVILSKKHGVNPTIPACYYCNQPKDEIVFLGKLKGDEKAEQHMVVNDVPCDKCKIFMQKGVILVSVKDDDQDKHNPYRTGGFVVMRRKAVKRLFKLSKKNRFAFVEDKLWDIVGLPRGDIKEKECDDAKI